MRAGRIFGTLLLAAFGSVVASLPAAAQSCGGDVSTSGSITGTVDPFIGGTGTVSGVLTVNRLSAAQGGGKTQDYAFFLVPRPAGALPSGSQITFSGVNILNTSNPLQMSNPPPKNAGNLPGGQVAAYAGSTPSGYLEVGFSGASQPDTQVATVNFTINIVAGLPAGDTTVFFDIYYVCKGTGGYSAVTTPTLGNSNVSLVVTSLSALKASLVGSNLDFGEIGSTLSGGSTAQLPSDIWVASNGPYSVAMTSCNHFVLYAAGGCTAPTLGTNTVQYNVSFLGQKVGYGGTSSTFTTVTCHAAGVSGKYLPISATTAEAGKGKLPSNAYSDTLSLTFTPLGIAQDGAAVNCP